MHITRNSKLINEPQYKLSGIPERSVSGWVIIEKSEYRRLNIFQGILLVILLGLLPGLVFAEADQDLNKESEWGRGIDAGSFLIKSENGQYHSALRMDSEVHFEVNGLIAKSKVKQTFKNSSKSWMQGIYVFPLPENAAVDRLRVHVGERIIEGKIKEKLEAKKIYQRAIENGNRAALVEQERPNMFTTSVANIGPDEVIVVEIEYLQTLQYDSGKFSLRFPMTITPRYIPGRSKKTGIEKTLVDGSGWSMNTDEVDDASRITPLMQSNKHSLQNLIKITANINAGFELSKIDSLYHDININKSDQKYSIELQTGRVSMDRDFELVWRPVIGSEPKAAFFRQNINGEAYGLIMIMPPETDNNLVELQVSMAREVIFVIDTSGSMSGASMEQAKKALIMALNTLTPEDRFNVIEFNSVTKKLFTQAVNADNQSLQAAENYINNLVADGGTEMVPALEAALNGDALDGYIRQVIFVTDGSVGNEDALFRLIESSLNDSRLFTVGIGSAPNSFFMKKSAQFGRGTYTFIGSQNEVGEKMQTLFGKLTSPVMSSLTLSWSGKSPTEVWPSRLTDLYKNEPLIISAKLDVSNTSVTLMGKTKGQSWQKNINLKNSKIDEGVASVWARNKIESLMDKMVSEKDSTSLKTQIIKVALEHQLVSKYTSLIAVDPLVARPGFENLRNESVKNVMPHGSQQQVPSYGFPQTATPVRIKLLLGLLALLFAATIVLAKKHYEV
jgi:Ca-activated chloride channel homolog